MIVYVSIEPGIIFTRTIASWLGAEGAMRDNCELYAGIILLSLPAFILQYEFQSFFATAEKPQFGLYVTLAAGCTNIISDALSVAFFKMGIAGAAGATALSQALGESSLWLSIVAAEIVFIIFEKKKRHLCFSQVTFFC